MTTTAQVPAPRGAARVDRVLASIARRARRRPSLGDAVFFGRMGAYLTRRFGAFTVTRFGAALLHVVEVLVLAATATHAALVFALLVRHGATLIEAAWWGGLETYRDDIRRATRTRRMRLRAALVARWRRISLAASLACVAVGVAVVAAGVFQRGFGVDSAFALVVIARLAVDLPLRTYNATVLALRRVYRPSWTFLGPDAAALVVIVALVSFIGAWAIPLASLCAGAASSLAAFVYTRRATASLRIDTRARRTTRPRGATHTVPIAWPRFVAAGLAWAATRSGSVLVFLHASSGSVDFETAALSVTMLLSAPLLDAVLAHANLLYVDFARLPMPLWRHARLRLARRTFVTSLVAAALAFAFVAVVAGLFVGPYARSILPPLALVFAVRAPLALLQVERFTAGARSALVVSGLALVVADLAVRATDAPNTAALCAGAAAALAVLIAAVLVPAAHPRPRAALVAVVEIGGRAAPPLPVIVRRLARVAAGARAVGDHLVVADLRAGATQTSVVAPIARALAGFAKRIDVVAAADVTGTLAARARNVDVPRDVDDVLARFRARFPTGVAVRTRDGTVVSGGGRTLDRGVRSNVFARVERFLDEGIAVERGADSVFAYAPHGVVELVLFAPRRDAAGLRARFGRDVLLWSALAP